MGCLWGFQQAAERDFDGVETKADYAKANKAMQTMKTRINGCIKQTEKAAAQLEAAIARHQGRVSSKQDAAAKSVAQSAAASTAKARDALAHGAYAFGSG